MEYNLLNKETPELSDQLDFLIKYEFYMSYFKYRRPLKYLIGVSLLIAGLFIYSDPQRLISLKAVSLAMITLSWFIIGILYSVYLFKRYKRALWKKETINFIKKNDTSFQFAFDENNLYFISDTYKTEIGWNYYKYFTICNNSIFIFPENNIYEALYYSKNELGIAEFNRLFAIVSKNLSKLEIKNSA